MTTKLISKKDLSKELLSFIFGILSTAIGFFLALWVNSSLDNQREIKTFETTKRMIVNEMKINKTIVNNSYVKYAYETPGLIYADLTTSISEEMIKDEKFISHTGDSILYSIQSYLRYIRILNTYKSELNSLRKKFQNANIGREFEAWETPLVENILMKRDSLLFYIDIIQKDIGSIK